MFARNNPEKWREYNTRQYAKKLGLTVEQYLEKRAAEKKALLERQEARKRETQRRKEARAIKTIVSKKPKPKSKVSHLKKQELYFEHLKKKHAKWKGTRLEKSINKPFFLTHSIEERQALKVEE